MKYVPSVLAELFKKCALVISYYNALLVYPMKKPVSFHRAYSLAVCPLEALVLIPIEPTKQKRKRRRRGSVTASSQTQEQLTGTEATRRRGRATREHTMTSRTLKTTKGFLQKNADEQRTMQAEVTIYSHPTTSHHLMDQPITISTVTKVLHIF